MRSLYKIKPPINETIGCKARMIVELATDVNFNEPNHSAKCNAKNNPEKNNNIHCFWDIFRNSARLVQTMGNNKPEAIHMRYILEIVAGASDHFTKMAENDIAIIETTNGKTIDFEGLSLFNVKFPLVSLELNIAC